MLDFYKQYTNMHQNRKLRCICTQSGQFKNLNKIGICKVFWINLWESNNNNGIQYNMHESFIKFLLHCIRGTLLANAVYWNVKYKSFLFIIKRSSKSKRNYKQIVLFILYSQVFCTYYFKKDFHMQRKFLKNENERN